MCEPKQACGTISCEGRDEAFIDNCKYHKNPSRKSCDRFTPAFPEELHIYEQQIEELECEIKKCREHLSALQDAIDKKASQ